MTSDTRTYIRLADDLPENPKIVSAGESAEILYIRALAYCSRNLTDGRVPKAIVPRLVTSTSRRRAKALVENKLWEDHGAYYLIPDYLEHQRSRSEIEAQREAKRQAGRKGGIKSGESRRASRTPSETNPVSVSVALSESDTSRSSSSTTESTGVQNRETAVNGRPTPSDLIDRMNVACKHGDVRIAAQVVDVLTDHVDPTLIDECIGFTMKLEVNKQPNDPRYFLTAVRKWALDRGVSVPELSLPSEPARTGLTV